MYTMSRAMDTACTYKFFEWIRWMFHPSSSFNSLNNMIQIGKIAVSAHEKNNPPGAVNRPNIPKNCWNVSHLNTIHPIVTKTNTKSMDPYFFRIEN